MILEIIATLGLTILFTETPKIDCGYANYDGQIYGCYYQQQKIIYLGYTHPEYFLYHELGHAIFMNDNYSRIIIKDYEPMIEYDKKFYNTTDKLLDERVADYFTQFKLNPKIFSVEYPCLFIYFRDTLNKLK